MVLELEAIDRMYLNVYVLHLQTAGAVVGYLRMQHGQRFASTMAVAPMTEAFIRNIERFTSDESVDLVTFTKKQRKDDVTQRYLKRFRKSEGVLYVGKAQEKARVMRTERRRSSNAGATYPWIVESTAMVNRYYFYCVDEDFGPFFLKFCSYFPYNAKLCINGHEYLKHQLAAVARRGSSADHGCGDGYRAAAIHVRYREPGRLPSDPIGAVSQSRISAGWCTRPVGRAARKAAGVA